MSRMPSYSLPHVFVSVEVIAHFLLSSGIELCLAAHHTGFIVEEAISPRAHSRYTHLNSVVRHLQHNLE